MFDRQVLKNNLIMLFVVIVFFGLTRSVEQAKAAMSAAFVLVVLYLSLKPTLLPIKTKDLFDVHFDANEFKSLMGKDEDFRKAVMYAYGLSPDDFIRFGRLLCEIRYNNDQNFLRDITDLYRSGK